MAEYTITIKNATGDGGSPGVAASVSAPKNSNSTAKEELSPIKPMAALGIAKQVATTVISHNVNTVALRTGQEELQQRMQFRWEMTQKGASLLGSVAVGAMTGGLAGAVVGAGVSVMMTALDYAQRSNEINLNRTAENISIDMANTRAGAMDDRQGRNY